MSTSVAATTPSLYGTPFPTLVAILGGPGRARAVWRAVRDGRSPFDPEAFGAKAHGRLVAGVSDHGLRCVERRVAACGTRRLAVALEDGAQIETVVIPHPRRTTVCLSSQVGCARACRFCVTATMGLERSLDAGAMVGQVKLAIDEARSAGLPPVRNAVFMGMGEPLDNLAATSAAIGILTDPLAMALAPAMITLSTVGTDPQSIVAAGRLPVRLAWSLHAADDAVRRQLVPTTRHPVAELRDAFVEALRPRRALLFVELTLIDGVNDDDPAADALIELLAPLGPEVRVNLLPMNPGRSGLRPASASRVDGFRQRVRAAGLFCSVRTTRGAEVGAACGQLTARRRVG